MSLLGKSYAHYGEALGPTETETELQKKALRARKVAEDILPYKKFKFLRNRYPTKTVVAVYPETARGWNRVWLERENKRETESIAIMMDHVDEETTLGMSGRRGMGRYRPQQLGAIESEGRVSIGGVGNPNLQEQVVFVNDALETLNLIFEQQRQERIRHFAGSLALLARK